MRTSSNPKEIFQTTAQRKTGWFQAYLEAIIEAKGSFISGIGRTSHGIGGSREGGILVILPPSKALSNYLSPPLP